jgi:hypothetical protein
LPRKVKTGTIGGSHTYGLKMWRDGRAVEGARLESVYTATYQGFESLSLRQLSIQRDSNRFKNPQVYWLRGFFYAQKKFPSNYWHTYQTGQYELSWQVLL